MLTSCSFGLNAVTGVGQLVTPLGRPQQEFRFDLPKYLSQLSRSDAQIVQVFRAEMVRLAAVWVILAL